MCEHKEVAEINPIKHKELFGEKVNALLWNMARVETWMSFLPMEFE